jgi:hypothetical protein
VLVAARLRELAMRCPDPAAVAVYLRRRQIIGVPASASRCPIANWLRKVTGVTDLHVWVDRVAILHEDAPDERVPLPAVLQAFQQAFDRHRYPQLIDYSRLRS